jgi:hypothetical protein
LAVILAGVGFAMPAAAQDHGIGTAKSCQGPTKIGDTKTCTIRINNQDEFGDSVTVTEFWDVIDPAGLNIRLPAAGNLPIIEVSAGVVCAGVAIDPDTAPIGLVFPCTIPGTAQGGGSNLLVRVRAMTTVPAGSPDPLPDQGNARAKDNCDGANTQNCSEILNLFQIPAAVQLFQPSIEVTKTGPELAKVGDELSYSVSFANTSSADTPALSCTASDSLVGDLGPITAGVPINYQRTVQQGDPDPLVNTATVLCTPAGFANEVTDSDEVSTDLFEPSIEVTKIGPEVAKVGDELNYSVSFANTSSAGTPALTCTASDSLAGDLGPITAGVPVNYSRTVQPGDPDPLVNTATVTCSIAGFQNEVSDFDSVSTDLFAPSIEVTKTGPEVAKVGDTLDYSVSFANTSPAGTPALTCSAADSLAGPLGAIVDGVPINYQHTVQLGDPDPLVNTVTVTCSIEGFPNEVSDSDSVTTDLLNPSVSLTKECRPDPVSVGSDITWAITVENTGDAALDCLVNDATAGFVDEPVSLAGGASDSINASREVLPEDAPTISNTASVECTLTGALLPNVVSDEAAADCEVQVIDEICRTPGFWGTHAGTEKKNSSNLTQTVITAAGGSLSVCGATINNTNVGNVTSAVEAICVSIQGEQQRQLARQLTAMALNCVVSGGGADCTGTSVEDLFADADAACIANSGNLSGFIAEVDCFNNGGQFDSGTGICTIDPEDPNNCHERELSESDVFEGVSPLPGPAGSSNACSAATGNTTFVVP